MRSSDNGENSVSSAGDDIDNDDELPVITIDDHDDVGDDGGGGILVALSDWDHNLWFNYCH